MKRGFTLIDALVAGAIIALLLAILLPSLVGARAEGKRAVCLSNLKQIGLATAMYLDANREYFWRYYVDAGDGRHWWFGFEPGGPPANPFNKRHRPLDKSKGALARYLRSTEDGLQCPAFPYNSGGYFPKFAARSASYGFNLRLGPANPGLRTRRRTDFSRRISAVFVFADGVHFDFNPGMNEGHYIAYVHDPAAPFAMGGFGHFRHRGRAQVVYIDGHGEGQPLRGPAYAGHCCGGPAGNLSSPSAGSAIYGD